MNEITKKQCALCKEEKPISDFRRRSGKQSHKFQSYCRRCEKHYWRHGPNRYWARLSTNIRAHEGGTISANTLKTRLGFPSDCYLCGRPITEGEAELDHIHPLSQGGGTVIENLRWAHRRCNRMKHDMTIEEFLEQARVMLKHLEG